MTNTVFSATEIRGLILKGNVSSPSDDAELSLSDSFPKQHYDIHDMIIVRANEPVTLRSGLKITKDSYNMFGNTGSLDLISYNEKTGHYKYRLLIKVKELPNAP